jgi:hypothetical protein
MSTKPPRKRASAPQMKIQRIRIMGKLDKAAARLQPFRAHQSENTSETATSL